MGLVASKQDYPSCLRALQERDMAPDDDSFWEAFWALPQSVEDVFNNIKPEDVRHLKQHAPRNLALLLHKAKPLPLLSSPLPCGGEGQA